MDNIKNEKYFLNKIVKDIKFVIEHCKNISLNEFNNDEILNNAVCFKIVQISENCKQLSDDFTSKHPMIPWKMIIGMRNKIVHDYGNVQLDIVYNTIKHDLPELLKYINELLILI